MSAQKYVETAKEWVMKCVTMEQLMETQDVLPTAGLSLQVGYARMGTHRTLTLALNVLLGGTKTILPPPLIV